VMKKAGVSKYWLKRCITVTVWGLRSHVGALWGVPWSQSW